MPQTVPTIAIIDPDDTTCDTLAQLLADFDMKANTYRSAETFLHELNSAQVACLVSETRLPGIDGLELLQRLTVLKRDIPTIFITQHADVSLAVTAMRAGAMDFIEKPFIEPVLVQLIKGVVTTGTVVYRPINTL